MDRVVVSGEGWLANFVIAEKGGRPILIRGVNKGDTARAGALIEERVARANAGPMQASPPTTTIDEESLNRSLTELRDAGILSEVEFETKRRGCCGTRGRTRRSAAHSAASPSDEKTESCSMVPLQRLAEGSTP